MDFAKDEYRMKTSRNPDTVHKPVAPYVHQVEVTGQTAGLLYLDN